MLRNRQRIFATAALVIASSAYAANSPSTVGDVIDRQATTQRAEKSRVLPAFTIPNEDNEIPSVASMSGIGNALTVKFSIRDGVVSVSEPGETDQQQLGVPAQGRGAVGVCAEYLE